MRRRMLARLQAGHRCCGGVGERASRGCELHVARDVCNPRGAMFRFGVQGAASRWSPSAKERALTKPSNPSVGGPRRVAVFGRPPACWRVSAINAAVGATLRRRSAGIWLVGWRLGCGRLRTRYGLDRCRRCRRRRRRRVLSRFSVLSAGARLRSCRRLLVIMSCAKRSACA